MRLRNNLLIEEIEAIFDNLAINCTSPLNIKNRESIATIIHNKYRTMPSNFDYQSVAIWLYALKNQTIRCREERIHFTVVTKINKNYLAPLQDTLSVIGIEIKTLSDNEFSISKDDFINYVLS